MRPGGLVLLSVAVDLAGAGEGKARVGVEHERGADAADPAQPRQQGSRRGGAQCRVHLVARHAGKASLVHVDQDVAGRGAADLRGPVLGVLGADDGGGHGGDEQREDQAADRPEGGPGIVGEPPRGDERRRAAGPQGHDPRPGHGQPRAGQHQARHDQGESGQERLDLAGDGLRDAAHHPETELGQSRQQREHPPGPRRLRGHPAGNPERGDVHPVQRQPGRDCGGHRHADRHDEDVGQAKRQVAGEERLAGERNRRERAAQAEEDPEPRGHAADGGHRGLDGGDHRDLLRAPPRSAASRRTAARGGRPTTGSRSR